MSGSKLKTIYIIFPTQYDYEFRTIKQTAIFSVHLSKTDLSNESTVFSVKYELNSHTGYDVHYFRLQTVTISICLTSV
jgi:hypothetical protein